MSLHDLFLGKQYPELFPDNVLFICSDLPEVEQKALKLIAEKIDREPSFFEKHRLLELVVRGVILWHDSSNSSPALPPSLPPSHTAQSTYHSTPHTVLCAVCCGTCCVQCEVCNAL